MSPNGIPVLFYAFQQKITQQEADKVGWQVNVNRIVEMLHVFEEVPWQDFNESRECGRSVALVVKYGRNDCPGQNERQVKENAQCLAEWKEDHQRVGDEVQLKVGTEKPGVHQAQVRRLIVVVHQQQILPPVRPTGVQQLTGELLVHWPIAEQWPEKVQRENADHGNEQSNGPDAGVQCQRRHIKHLMTGTTCFAFSLSECQKDQHKAADKEKDFTFVLVDEMCQGVKSTTTYLLLTHSHCRWTASPESGQTVELPLRNDLWQSNGILLEMKKK